MPNDEVTNELTEAHLVRTAQTERHSKPKNTEMQPLLHELATDAANGLIERMAWMNRYREYGQISSAHSLVTILWENTPAVIVFSASVLPIEHINIYGKTFADDLKPMVERAEKPTPRRCDCENNNCGLAHEAGDCENVGGAARDIFGGTLCAECLKFMPDDFIDKGDGNA